MYHFNTTFHWLPTSAPTTWYRPRRFNTPRPLAYLHGAYYPQVSTARHSGGKPVRFSQIYHDQLPSPVHNHDATSKLCYRGNLLFKYIIPTWLPFHQVPSLSFFPCSRAACCVSLFCCKSCLAVRSRCTYQSSQSLLSPHSFFWLL